MPNETVVTVRGSHSTRHQPDLVTAQLGVGGEGPDKAEVYRRTAGAAQALVATVRALADAPGGPVTRWSNDRLSTWFERPWDQHGRQLAPVHHARAVVRATFHDLDAFGTFLDDVGTRDQVTVDELTWALTEERTRETAREVRRAAVLDAVERARDYAGAAGFTDVRVVAVADVGLLGDATSQDAVFMAQAGRLAGKAQMVGGGGMSFAPEEIVVEAAVEARFVTI